MFQGHPASRETQRKNPTVIILYLVQYQKSYLYMKGMWLGGGGGELLRKLFPGKTLRDFCQGWKGISSRKNSICKSREARENMIKTVWLETRLCKKKMREETRAVGEPKTKRIFLY